MPDFQREWLEKSRIDYFPPFISLWLAFNAWYRSHYSELAEKTDRKIIDHIKQDHTPRNKLLTTMNVRLSDQQTKENIRFKSNLEALHYSLNRAALNYDKIQPHKPLTLESALIDFSLKNDASAYISLLKTKRQQGKIKLDEIFVTDELPKVMAGVLETIYQVRCHLFHGSLSPEKENHEVVKYAYSVLYDLMQ